MPPRSMIRMAEWWRSARLRRSTLYPLGSDVSSSLDLSPRGDNLGLLCCEGGSPTARGWDHRAHSTRWPPSHERAVGDEANPNSAKVLTMISMWSSAHVLKYIGRWIFVGLLRQPPPTNGQLSQDTFSLRVAGVRSTIDALDRLDPIFITYHGPRSTCGQPYAYNRQLRNGSRRLRRSYLRRGRQPVEEGPDRLHT